MEAHTALLGGIIPEFQRWGHLKLSASSPLTLRHAKPPQKIIRKGGLVVDEKSDPPKPGMRVEDERICTGMPVLGRANCKNR